MICNLLNYLLLLMPGKWKWKSLFHFGALYSPWNSPGQNIGVGSLSLLQEIFPGIEPRSPTLWVDSLPVEPQEKLPWSSLSRIQGYPQDERHRRERWHRETKLRWSRVCSFILKRSFYTLIYTFPEVKDAESCRVSSRFHQFWPLLKPGCFLHTFSFTRVLCYVHYFLAQRPVDILWPFSDKGWSTRKLVFP